LDSAAFFMWVSNSSLVWHAITCPSSAAIPPLVLSLFLFPRLDQKFSGEEDFLRGPDCKIALVSSSGAHVGVFISRLGSC
jgi:hypothetical protein